MHVVAGECWLAVHGGAWWRLVVNDGTSRRKLVLVWRKQVVNAMGGGWRLVVVGASLVGGMWWLVVGGDGVW